MVVETEVIPYFRWLWTDSGDGHSGLVHFLLTAAVLLALATVLAYLVAAFRRGPVQGAKVVGLALWAGLVDIARMSPRRVWGLTVLAVREAFRRYIWVALVVFLVILLFAGWFLDPGSDEPAKLYLSFVLNAATYLLLVVALYLSALSLPADIKSRTIYTIVTKPVRASEIVLGRVLGFTLSSTVLLSVMAGASYLFVSRALSHVHEIQTNEVSEVRQNRQLVRYGGETTQVAGHRHKFSVPADSFSPGVELAASAESNAVVIRQVTAAARAAGINPGDVMTAIDGQAASGVGLEKLQQRLLGPAGSQVRLTLAGAADRDATLTRDSAQVSTELERGHSHRVTVRWLDGQLSYEVGPAEGTLVARVPNYGTLRFRDREGDSRKPSTWKFREKGISVGKLFTYRSYIEGNTLAAAVWNFEGLRPEDYPDGLPLDIDLRVYRGYKGKVDQGITGSLLLRNPKSPQVRSRETIFTAKEFATDRIDIPRQLTDANGRPLDLFQDLVSDGQVEVWVRCVQPGQYFGMARADLYVRAADASYTLNFCKAFAEVGLQVALVTALAVLFSTFLSGPVAIVQTVTVILMGFKSKFIYMLTNCVIFRDELQAMDRLRQMGLRLDARGLQRAAELKAAEAPGFAQLSLEKLQQVPALGLDQLSVLDRVYGGGPLEAFYRLVTQKNLVVDLEPGIGTTIIQSLDNALMHVMQYLLHVLPDFRRFSDTDYLASGYNIPADLVLQHATATLAFVGVAFVAGYFVMKNREVGR